MRGLGVASDKRNAAIPDVPTYGEMGYPNVYSGSWVGFFAPAKTPDAVVAEAQHRDQRGDEGAGLARQARPRPASIRWSKSVAETDAYFKSEVENWGKMVNAIGFSN